MNSNLMAKLQKAAALHGQGQVASAKVLYEQVLGTVPDNPDALHLLGVAETQLGRPTAGIALIGRSLAINPDQPFARANLGHAFLFAGDFSHALDCYDMVLTKMPSHAPALNGRGTALFRLGRLIEARDSIAQALQLAPDFVEAWHNLGNVLSEQGQPAEALAAHDRALRLQPRDAIGLMNRGIARAALGQHEDAAGDYVLAMELQPGQAEIHYNHGISLLALEQADAAMGAFERALVIAPAYAEAIHGRGEALSAMGRPDEAIEAYTQALNIRPDLASALFSRGVKLVTLGRRAAGVQSLKRLQELERGYAYAAGALMHARLHIYDWTDFQESANEIVGAVGRGDQADYPFSFLAVADIPELQLRCAQNFAATFRDRRFQVPKASRSPHERIRVAYMSADFLEHPTAFLLAGLLEQHSRDQFEVIVISLRTDQQSHYSRRVRAAADRWVDAEHLTSPQLAALIQDLEVDIVVDLMGFTGEHRAGALAGRPAPIQVNYLGFPGTMGADYMDYMIVDDYLVPAIERTHYREQLVYLPECFQANDDQRPGTERPSTRAEAGLPPDAFVWSSFNSSAKLNPPLFDVWCRLLRAVPESVLWILANDTQAEANLSNEAEARGIEAKRLVFAKRILYRDHIARLGLADLALDTYPFNGGATTSDALWAGVPVVTCSGRSMAARMSGSLLRTANLPELITGNLAEYEQLAMSLATNPDRLAILRDRLHAARIASPLFDARRFRRHIESAYVAMWERHQRGEPPGSINVMPT